MKYKTMKQFSKFLGGMLILGAVIYFVNIRPAIANHTLQIGFKKAELGNYYNSLYTQTKEEQYRQLAKDNFENSVIFMRKAIDFNTFQSSEFKGAFAETVIGFHRAETLPDYKAGEYLAIVLQELEKNILDNSRDVQIYAYTMAAYNISAQHNLKYLDRSVELGEIAVKLSPNRQQIYSELAKAKISQKKYDEAIAYFQKAIDLNPMAVDSYWNLAVAYTKIGNIEKAQEATRKMENLEYVISAPSDALKWIFLHEKTKDWKKVAWLYDKLLKLDPFSAYYLDAAKANQQAGNIEKAKEYAQIAAEKDQTLQEAVEKFLNGL